MHVGIRGSPDRHSIREKASRLEVGVRRDGFEPIEQSISSCVPITVRIQEQHRDRRPIELHTPPGADPFCPLRDDDPQLVMLEAVDGGRHRDLAGGPGVDGLAAIGFAVIGVVATVAATILPPERAVLLAVGAVGFFSAVLAAYLMPEGSVAASGGERVFAQLIETLADLADALGLSDHRVYVPVEEERSSGVRRFVPQLSSSELPSGEDRGDVHVIPANDGGRGLSVRPTGIALYREFEVDVGEDPVTPAHQRCGRDVATFELADHVEPEVAPNDGRASFAVTGNGYGRVDRIDYPGSSTIACGLVVIGADDASDVWAVFEAAAET